MTTHDISTLQKNLRHLTKQVDAIANFKKHHGVLRQILISEFDVNAPFLKEIQLLTNTDNAVSSFFTHAQSFFESKWLDAPANPETLNLLDSVRELEISMKGLADPASYCWTNKYFNAELTFAFGENQFKSLADITCGNAKGSVPLIAVTYVEFNYKSIIDIADELNPIERNKLVLAAFKSAERMFEQYILTLDTIECSASEEIRFNLNILDEIELKDAIYSTSMDTLSATQPRQIQSLESKMMTEVDDMCESVIGSSVKVCREDVCDAIEKVLH
ncbi:hypothetical protein OTK49_21015 [Vibrio coralliirubri]|uniref:hypothetical protein n=1 Tax=Vibrio coralliirubri TaxID=1516159 RepID=UPI0022848DD1|nr:hypothetical protein [Vibrio coralliirubri]MCY9865001.1 hypothetical protein [Vibrio coralliirubri]